MASTPAFCPQCGTPLQTGQRFCTNCGATTEINASDPTIAAAQTPAFSPGNSYPNPPGTPPMQASQGPTSGTNYTYSQQSSQTPPPPPPNTYNPYTNSAGTNTPGYARSTVPDYTPPLSQTALPPQVPAYAQKPQSRGGCVVGSIVLLLILALGIGGYFLVHALASSKTAQNPNGTSGTPTYNATGTTTGSGGSPTSQAQAATTQQLNLQVTYASVNLTIISVQKASNFADDTNTTPGKVGIIRINLRENNTTTGNPDYILSESMFLLLPGNSTVKTTNQLNGVSPDAGVNRTNWLDFPLDTQVALNQLILRLGTQTESQMDIPLQANANLSIFQDKTRSPNTAFKYGPLNMTLKTTTLSYSYHDQQATAGNRYVIVTLGAVNTSSSSAYLSASNSIRMQAGGNSVSPDSNYSFPSVIEASATGSGDAAFLVPQGTTSFTLVFLAQNDVTPAISQVTQTFQIQ